MKTEGTPCLYFIRQTDGGYIKIGITSNLRSRLIQLQSANPHRLEIIHSIKYNDIEEAAELESFLHNKFSYSRVSGEWFNPDKMLLETIDHIIGGGVISFDDGRSTLDGAIMGWGVWDKINIQCNDLCRVGAELMREGDRRKINFFIAEVNDIIDTVTRPYKRPRSD